MKNKAVKDSEIYFVELDESHFPLIHAWFNKPHVQLFYSLKPWTLEEVRQKLTPRLHREEQKGYIVYFRKQPIGYIQRYPIKDYPLESQDLPDKVIQEAAGIDLFIGEEEFSGKNLGYRIVNCFLEECVWPLYRYCLADPDIRNTASIRLFQKCGFKEHKRVASKDALQRDVSLQLFIKEREK